MPDNPNEADREQLGPQAYRALYDFSPVGVLFTAPDGRVLAANPAACAMLRRSEAEICTLGRRGLVDPSDPRWEPLVAERARSGEVHGIARMLRGDGAAIEIEMSSRLFIAADGEPRACVVVRDVTERIRMERELARLTARLHDMTVSDELTGLHNRRGFLAVASQALELADRHGSPAVLLFLDLDNLKELNDRYGHQAGDAALRTVAGALADALRRADTLARIGGDEFVALAVGVDDADREEIEQRIEERLSTAVVKAGSDARVEASIGWATREPGASATLEDLLAEADREMYRAKGRGGARGRPASGV